MWWTKGLPTFPVELKEWSHWGASIPFCVLLIHQPSRAFMFPRCSRLAVNCGSNPDVTVCVNCNSKQPSRLMALGLSYVRTQYRLPALAIVSLGAVLHCDPKRAIAAGCHAINVSNFRDRSYRLIMTISKSPDTAPTAEPDCLRRPLDNPRRSAMRDSKQTERQTGRRGNLQVKRSFIPLLSVVNRKATHSTDPHSLPGVY